MSDKTRDQFVFDAMIEEFGGEKVALLEAFVAIIVTQGMNEIWKKVQEEEGKARGIIQ